MSEEGAGTEVARGKTKQILTTTMEGVVQLVSYDDTTAGDGAKHELMDGKAALSTRTTVNCFELLKWDGVPLAYLYPGTERSFFAKQCEMIPLEVVVRGKAYGSILKRDAKLTKAEAFLHPRVEFFLKTKNRAWEGHQLPCDDPLAMVVGTMVRLYRPDHEFAADNHFMEAAARAFFDGRTIRAFENIAKNAAHAFIVLRAGYAAVGLDFVDMKVEFGWSPENELVLADVIDADSARILRDGVHLDKQNFREGASAKETRPGFEAIAAATDSFGELRPTIRTLIDAAGYGFAGRYRLPI